MNTIDDITAFLCCFALIGVAVTGIIAAPHYVAIAAVAVAVVFCIGWQAYRRLSGTYGKGE